jgi:hypothetical protein
MRAADRAHTTATVPAQQLGTLLSRLLVAAIATIALLLVWRPSLLYAQGGAGAAQEPASKTHVVKAGETLWGIAARYYGDGHQWRALAQRNGLSISDEPSLAVGLRLSVPAEPPALSANAAELAVARADSTVPKAALAKAGEGPLPAPNAVPSRAPAGALAAQTAGRGNAAASTTGRGAATAKRPPASATVAAMAPVASVSDSQADTGKANLTPATGTVMGERSVRRIGLADQEAAMNSRKPSEVVTVFHRDLPDAAEAERRTRAVLRPNTPTPRLAEYMSAPFVTTVRSLETLGRISARVGSPSAGDAYPQRAIMTDEVEVEAPIKQSFKVGDHLLSFGSPVAIDKEQVVVLPTGMLEVTRAESGKPALAVVRRQSGRIEAGQQIVMAPDVNAPWVRAVPLDKPDVPSTIRWLDPQEAQPTLQSYLVIGAGSAKGLAAGDEVAIYRRLAKGTTEAMAATARVIRVERDYATAIITKQYQTDIAVGLPVRRYAKAP